ncbi:hypothetical protein HYV56_02245 [Candidatus Peregrinibacteria bacterium]|nr:hypothetical protein [Candidatus Peregrinibacteria bacterium]
MFGFFIAQNTLEVAPSKGGLNAGTPVPDLIGTLQQFETVELINRFIAYAIIVAGFLSLVFVFVGGISFILSGGQEDKIKQAVGTIRHAIFGLIITVLAVVIVATVGKALGLNIIQYINFSDIVDFIREVTSGGASGGISLD